MAYRNQSSEVKDPLQVYSGLSLFPRTLKASSNPLPPAHLHQSDDLQHTHRLMESMPIKIQSELLEQAKSILDCSSEFLNPKIPVNVVSEDKNEDDETNLNANRRERRPGLGRKRARFSMKPTTSQPAPDLGPKFDDTKYQKPEDFFAAYDKFEKAQREWQKQTGAILTDTDNSKPAIRPRRPGIEGRKRATYTHRYSTASANLEALDEDIVSTSKQSPLKSNTEAHSMTMDGDLADSTTEMKNDVDNILGDLLACNQEELEGDGAVNLLEERLKIKPIEIEKLSLPELKDVRKSNVKVSRGGKASKPRSALLDIQNMVKTMRSETSQKSSQTPSPLQSPVPSLSSLKKRLPSPNPQDDQFSFPDYDHLLPGDINTTSLDEQQCREGDAHPENNTDADDTTSSVFPANVNTRDLAASLFKSVSKTSTDSNMGRSDSSEEEDMGDGINDRVTELNVEIQAEGDNGEPNNTNGASQGEDVQQINSGNENTELTQKEKKGKEKKKSKKEAGKGEGSKQAKGKVGVSRESKVFGRRKSLTGAGSKWEAGVRRSTRIKSRPLEYWKGERFLYGRIHESLATVIGIKYESPGKEEKGEGKAKLKVKSYVSPQYQQLLDRAALH